jgi:hypothetical protein
MECIGTSQSGCFVCSKDNEIATAEFLQQHKGKPIIRLYTVKKPSKTLQQLRFLRGVGFPQLAEYLGYGDINELIYYFKEMCMKGTISVKSPHTGHVKVVEYHKSFADLTKDEMSNIIDRFLVWCMELGFPLSELYLEYVGGNK